MCPITGIFLSTNFLIILKFLLLLSNCAAPGASLFGPVITGAATESLARASLSFTTNNILQDLNKNSFEVMLGYNFNIKVDTQVKRYKNPRFL